jgi:hypothetical protein
MMFPFALTLYSEAVQARLGAAQAGLPEAIRKRYAYDWGYKTVLNVLAQAEATRVSERVRERGAQFAELLSQALSSCAAVRSVRVHGLLIAIELDTGSWLRRRLKKGLTWLYLLGMIRHKSFPLFAGFCQYEPNVLKLTPPLSITPDEVRQVCATIASVLRTPLPELLLSAARTTVSLAVRRRVMPSRTGSRP